MIGTALRPRFGWLTDLTGGALVRDTIAGLILAILLVPQAMAYAQLAGLPPQTGLFAALLPPLIYALFGTSSFVSMGPVALVSLVVAEAAGNAPVPPETAAAVIAVEAGLALALLGALGLGRLVNFISEPVLLGFTAAAAFLIAASQLPTLIGVEAPRAGDLPTALEGLWNGLGGFSLATTLVGLACLAALLFINRYAAALLWKAGLHPPLRQAVAKSLPFVVIAAAAFAVSRIAEPVATVEAVARGLPSPPWPLGGPSLWLSLLPSALAVAVIVFVTATAVAKSLAGTDRSNLDTSREAVALGFGNIAAVVTGGYAVGASLSRSALVEDSGARSPLASVIASLVVLAVLLFLAPYLSLLPRTALAALVISAVFGLIKVRDIRDIFAHDRIEGAIVAIAFFATLIFGVRLGLAIGAGVGLAHFLWFSSLPRVTRVGTDDGGTSFRSVDRDAVEIDTLPVLIVRIDRSIYFGNAAFCEDELFARLAQHDDVTCLVIDMRAVNGVDASGAAMLRRLTERLREMEIMVRFAEAHAPVQRALKSLDPNICCFHRTIQAAMEACGAPVDETIAPT
ncbi:MAG: SulP family inorganic anion transporter [Erythrobacter sp.]|nr:SulP family inorganic anion transporter [Erythrobacter sp.]